MGKRSNGTKIMTAIALLCAVLALCSFLYFRKNYHRIEHDGNVTKCPKYAKAGDMVDVETVFVTDAYLELFVNGVRVEPLMEGSYVFRMPDNDVRIETRVVADESPYEYMDSPVYFESRMPVKVIYRRMWEYGDEAETEDPEIIKEVTDAMYIIHISPHATDRVVDDFTDVVILVFDDGSQQTYVFEEYNYINPVDDGRYPVTQGLEKLRTALDEIIENREG